MTFHDRTAFVPYWIIFIAGLLSALMLLLGGYFIGARLAGVSSEPAYGFYHSEAYGFEITYPKTMQIEVMEDDSPYFPLISLTLVPVDSAPGLRVYMLSNPERKEVVDFAISQTVAQPSFKDPVYITVGGIKSYQGIFESFDGSKLDTFVPLGDSVMLVQIDLADQNVSGNSARNNDYREILTDLVFD